ncbi:formylmethanofuran dehydrogenase subunit C [Methylocapsa aurea]|uniref:formylmethanofuran dehydrogenase subunit C n=1 Tax=Methylocapsa aurea TaxID=663610 RepID=UPI00056366FF|nr:formylmethanofuran dehydrogenase subunit C [Methylocapsa aurea]
MKPLVLALEQEPDQRLDLSPLCPHLLEGKSAKEIAEIELQTTREKVTVGDLFHIRAGSAQTIRFEGGSTRLDNIGFEMKSGEIVVEGDCGKSVGRNLSGGNLIVAGDAGPFAGSCMSGGRLEIWGDAGDFLGAPLEGEMEGMSGGLLILRGSAGARAGDRLRRGTILIEGSAGDYPGSRMIAGTLILLGECGVLPGYLMRRGTIVLANPPALAPTFVDCGVHSLAFASVFSRLLEPESRAAAKLLAGPLNRFAGDMAALGKGEILYPA